MLGRVARFVRTVRYLRFSQIYRRVFFRLARPKPNFAPTPPRAQRAGTWILPARKPVSLIEPDTFFFLNISRRLGDVGWNGPEVSKLWRYNQHYFDDLNAEEATMRLSWHQDLIAKWVSENPPPTGNGWEPYPTSLRIVNWVKWDLSSKALSALAVQSLAVQARWLMKRIEWHLLGNHLFANAKALIFAGLYFDGSDADLWLKTGLDILESEIDEQILADGGQFERSPMYHAIALEDMLDLLNVMRTFSARMPMDHKSVAERLCDRIPGMLRWLEAMSHPDGRIAFFNDAAFGIAVEKDELVAYAERLGITPDPLNSTVSYLEQSGFVRAQMGPAVLITDIGQIGPDYLPGHAHADTLSFELSLNGRRLVVNSGTSEYGLGSERQRQRSTVAHSTVVVDGQSSSEVWGGFRVGRRARPQNVEVRATRDDVLISGEHDGYVYLANKALHRREWLLGGNSLIVTDTVFGKGSPRVEARFHLAEKIVPSVLPCGTLLVSSAEGTPLAQISVKGGTPSFERTTWHPKFGVTHENNCIVIAANGFLPKKILTRFEWA